MAALVVLLVVGAGALYMLLPGWIDSPAVRERIEEAAYDITGRAFTYEKLGFGLMPPRLVVEGPSLAGENEGDAPFADAREISMKIALMPLLSKTLLLENLVVEEATVRLVRDGSGLRLPEKEEEEKEPGSGGGGPKGEGGGDDSGVDLAVQEFALRDARILLEDRTVSPASNVEVESLDVTVKFHPTDPMKIDADANLGGGSLDVEGTADLLAQNAEWEAKLDGISLALLAPYLGDGRSVAGTLSGSVEGKGEPASPDLVADLAVSDGVVQIRDINLQGPLEIQADLSGGEQRAGTFAIDATAAALDAYEGVFQKPAGKPGSVKGRFIPKGESDFAIDDVEIKIHNLDARGNVSVGTRVQAELTANPVSLEGWEEILPALAEYNASGTLAPGPLKLATDPLSFLGRIGLQGVRLTLPDGPEISLEGAIEGAGDAIDLDGITLTTGGEQVKIGGQVANLSADQQRFRLALDSEGAESNTLLSAFTAVDDQVYGPLFVDTDLTGRTGDADLATLAGRVAFAIRPGKIKDVSILRLTVEKLGTFGEAALLAAALDKPARAKKIDHYYGDEFEELAGTFDIAQGWARTRDLRLVYASYRVDLEGAYRLSDQKLDFTGTLTMDREIDEALADASGGDAGEKKEPRVIELAKVKGTLDEPKVSLSSSTVRGWVGGYSGKKVRGKYQEKLDEKLGEGLGNEVGDLVEGLFGGKR